MAMTLSGCASLNERMTKAAIDLGVSQAQVPLPEYPEDCRKQEEHTPIKAGDEARSVIKRERLALDRANSRIVRCGEFYDNVRASY